MLSSKRTPNRKFSTLAVAGSAIAVAAIASGAAASATTVADATGQAKAAATTTRHDDHARFSKTDRQVSARPAAYKVKPGDSLSSITGRLFGHADLWPRFYAANVKVVGADPNQITPGERLTVRLARHGETGTVTPAIQPVTSAPAAAAQVVPAASGGTASGGSFGSCVRARESGGNYQATNGGYYGAYQFSASTWAAYGGNPADFGNASAAEQDQVFANAMAQGGQSNWAPYDGC
jgi:Transglycosylase-like domain